MCWKVNKKKFNSFRSILHGAKNRFDPEKQWNPGVNPTKLWYLRFLDFCF